LTANQFSTFDIFFAKFSNSGAHQWSKHVTSSLSSSGIGLGARIDSNGNMLFTGKVYGTADFGGVSTSTSGMSTFVAKYSPTGGCLWAKAYSGNNQGFGVAADNAGNVFAGGNWSGTTDFGAGPMTSQSGGTDAFLLKLAP
jgi:hypothetical protein